MTTPGDSHDELKQLAVDRTEGELMILFSAADKAGVAFCTGAAIALRDIGLLDKAKVIIGTGMASFLVAQLMRGTFDRTGRPCTLVTATQTWRSFTSTHTDGGSPFVHHFARPMIEFCATNYESKLIRARFKSLFTGSSNPLEHRDYTAAVVGDMHTTDVPSHCLDHTPLFIFNASRPPGTPLLWNYAASSPSHEVEQCAAAQPSDITALPDILAMTATPYSATPTATTSGPVSNAVASDPLGLYAAQRAYDHLYQMRTRMRHSNNSWAMGDSKRLVVIDAVSGSQYYASASPSFQALCHTQIQWMFSSEAVDFATPRVVQGHYIMANDEAAYRGTAADTLRATVLAGTAASMTGLDRVNTAHCISAGCAITRAQLTNTFSDTLTVPTVGDNQLEDKFAIGLAARQHATRFWSSPPPEPQPAVAPQQGTTLTTDVLADDVLLVDAPSDLL
jgi:hypothetical protein